MNTSAIIIDKPESIAMGSLDLVERSADDVVVESLWSGVSSGTEKLLYTGSMPAFPGMRYPLVPGYETVGRVVEASSDGQHETGDMVFVPGANCYRDVAGLFGASASHLVVPAGRAISLSDTTGVEGTLLSLAATAHHAITLPGAAVPDVVVGHGVLGRLIARMMLAMGHPAPEVWERERSRHDGADGYTVSAGPTPDCRRYNCILDASGDATILDTALPLLAPRGEVILAGFYGERMAFPFVPAFMREAHMRVAAEFKPEDVLAVLALVKEGRLSLKNLITDVVPAGKAALAYAAAFSEPACLKMAIDWRTIQ